MKTGLNMVQDVFNLLNVPAINDIITGAGYMFERPKNSMKQDYVVNSLALTNAQVQNGVVNINIHCPNLEDVVIDGIPDETMPDIEAFNTITNAIMPIIQDVNGFDFHIAPLNSGILIRDNDGTFYINIRVEYKAFQNNYTYI